ncbi:unnamed protein product, partial [Amoebophrya sp. A120]
RAAVAHLQEFLPESDTLGGLHVTTIGADGGETAAAAYLIQLLADILERRFTPLSAGRRHLPRGVELRMGIRAQCETMHQVA